MALPGPAPKDRSKRARPNAPDRFAPFGREVALVPADDAERTLPDDLLPADQAWHPATLRWWETWATSSLMADAPATDWEELRMAAVIHHRMMLRPGANLAGELRQRMAKFGATPEDRMELRIQVVAAEEAERKAGKPAPSNAKSARHAGLRLADEPKKSS
jgi:hypothetical protein